jgi:hypothetical protein
MTDVPKIEHLRDVELRERKQCPFIIAVPCDERDARNFPLLDKFLRIIRQKIAICTGLPGERKRL